MTDSNRPWWADREVVDRVLDEQEHGAAIEYMRALADVIEHRIAYSADDPAAAASSALRKLRGIHRWPVEFEVWGGDSITRPMLVTPLERQRELTSRLDDVPSVRDMAAKIDRRNRLRCRSQ
ncbi:hypothetical protein SEA_TINIBUG_55 [Mycobacterium Phage TiniBug]|uniref:Uncharacterized protein n=1 Tax=Mycobacterium phage Urkel TaxID=1912978 RepID=A0A1I9S4T6_9CAUD|nr:hypothetical protein I5H07_gp48 [Mycobacterium phage Urkel]AOZ61386.1 hypothetical protein SEA_SAMUELLPLAQSON_55 [Mycobacterium phage SamuelLPlaqson]AOZ61483.1 hypothetical protein SEA_DRHAYES_55 [Mycobacterium phage DrHayes]AOZ61580.1 hypothetical protein SEA_URKEL_55 [Mycobacterium phage Urkel]WNM75410.1 hypothetical protein SEA_TINIBUG_55 [Mycobacterium Phage TiniBug]